MKNNETNNRATLPAAPMESNPCHEPVAEKEVARFNSPVRIVVTSYRKYPHDTDGCSVKAVLDGLTRSGILASDTSEFVKEITFKSVKSDIEKTIIEIASYTYCNIESWT